MVPLKYHHFIGNTMASREMARLHMEYHGFIVSSTVGYEYVMASYEKPWFHVKYALASYEIIMVSLKYHVSYEIVWPHRKDYNIIINIMASYEIIRCHEISWFCVKCHDSIWNIMVSDKVVRLYMKYHGFI